MEILKVLVGSQAHGLATPDSDYDYKSIFVAPTSEILALGAKPKNTQLIEGDEDNTKWELGHFLHLATHCNPTVLETFLAPTCMVTPDGTALRELFPHVWNSKGVMDAFVGYGLNQRKKFLEDKDKRPNKYAAAYLRSLYNAYELLTTGTFTVRIADMPIGETVRAYKNGEFTGKGDVINTCIFWEMKVREAYEANLNKEADLGKVNEFLLNVRKKNW